MRSSQPELRIGYSEALHALRLGRSALAEARARALLAHFPGEPTVLHLIGVAMLAQGHGEASIALLEGVVARAPQFLAARIDLARAYRACARVEEGLRALKPLRALGQLPGPYWLALGDLQAEKRLFDEARRSYDTYARLDPFAARIERARTDLRAGRRNEAEAAFRAILVENAAHIGALCGLAAVSLAVGLPEDARQLLAHAGKQTGHLPVLLRGLSQVALATGKFADAERAIRRALEIEPAHAPSWIALAGIHTQLMQQERALECYREALRLVPGDVALQLSIGHALKTLGRRAECEAAYRATLALDPTFGEAYWSLSELKNYRFSAGDLDAMQDLLANPATDDACRTSLHFALGRAAELRESFAEAFSHYASGCALRRRSAPFSIDAFEAKSERVIRTHDRAFFAARAGAGNPDGSPIFVIGLPRSGSTLVEQILASHPEIEGTMELQNVPGYVAELGRGPNHAYPEVTLGLPLAAFTALGSRYLAETQPLRTGKPFFIDKMPNNFSHVGLIHAMLPNAKFIDVRRHPLDACFSAFKQHFASGQSFTYDLEDLGRYYRVYLRLMDHWDRVLGDRVHHLSYEALIDDPERSVRDLLAYVGVAYSASCLSFHTTSRSVRTASSEQVRQPLYRSGVGHWRHYATELEPLRRALGDCLERFP